MSSITIQIPFIPPCQSRHSTLQVRLALLNIVLRITIINHHQGSPVNGKYLLLHPNRGERMMRSGRRGNCHWNYFAQGEKEWVNMLYFTWTIERVILSHPLEIIASALFLLLLLFALSAGLGLQIRGISPCHCPFSSADDQDDVDGDD